MDTATAAPSLARRLVTVVLATAIAFTLLPLLAKPAAAYPTYRTKSFVCDVTSFGRRVKAYPSYMETGSLQMVYWSPDLYRWNGSRWALYNGSKPWYWAIAGRNGIQYNNAGGGWFNPQNNPVQFVPFSGLPRGYYKVASHVRTGSTGHYSPANFYSQASEWAPYAGGGSYCHFR